MDAAMIAALANAGIKLSVLALDAYKGKEVTQADIDGALVELNASVDDWNEALQRLRDREDD
jgi:hypothetical protein